MAVVVSGSSVGFALVSSDTRVVLPQWRMGGLYLSGGGRLVSGRNLATISVRNTCSIFPDDEEICGCQAGFREFDRNFGRTIMIIGERKRLEGTSLVHVIF